MEKLLTIGDVYQPPTANELASAYSANLQNRLARMQMAEYEKKIAKESQRNELAKKYFTAGSPQIGTAGTAQVGTPAMPSETTWGVPQQSSNMMLTLGQSPTGPYAPDSGELSPFATRYSPAQAASPDYAPSVAPSTDYQAAVPATQDMEGYQRALYGAGDVEGGQMVQAQMDKGTESRMSFYKSLLEKAITNGDNNAVQQVVGTMKRERLLPPDFELSAALKQEPIKTILPYKIGERQKFIGAGGTEYEGTFKGLDEKGEPIFGNQVAVKKPPSATTPPDFKNEMLMRKEFLALPEVKDYPTIEAQSNRALKALQEPSGNKTAVDQAIITTFNKMMDPSSVVRESEYARTPQDMALLNRIKGKWEKLASGGAGLTDEERQSMYRMVSAFKDIADASYNAQVEHYSGLASQYGYKPENVVRLGGRQMGGVSATGGARPLPKF